jgi:cytosine/uracil/thiamine/allantoin permease
MNKPSRILVDAMFGLIVAVLGYFILAMVVLKTGAVSSNKTGPLLSLILGAPVGCIAGIFLCDRFVIRGTKRSILLLIVGIVVVALGLSRLFLGIP